MVTIGAALRRVLPLLEHRDFLKLWGSQLLNQPAGHVLNFVLGIRIFQITGSNAWVGALVALVSVPPILFSQMAGVTADRFNRKWIMVLTNLLRAGLVIGFFAFGHSPVALLAIGFAISTLNQFFGPAESASIPSLVPAQRIFLANSMFVFTVYASFLLGYSVAGPLLDQFGERSIFAVLVGVFALAAYLDVLLPRLTGHLGVAQRAVLTWGAVRSEVRDGIAFIRSRRVVWVVVLQLALVFAVERSLIALIPGFAETTLRFSVTDISLLLITPVAVGALLAVLGTNVLKKRWSKRRLITVGILLAGLSLLGFAFHGDIGDAGVPTRQDAAELLYLILLAGLTGFADVMIIVAAQTILHEETPDHTRGRVFGSLITLMNLLGLPMILLASWLANRIPVTDVLLGLGLFTVVLGALAALEERFVPGRLP